MYSHAESEVCSNVWAAGASLRNDEINPHAALIIRGDKQLEELASKSSSEESLAKLAAELHTIAGEPHQDAYQFVLN